ncbi:hypothetical protein D5018_09275 [Parashewanella curva]|uniref:Uncharacterized protein n=1 Tax=Parashewanella curva TaxID=2338552 RepID=A0A3L8PXJ2_9GAMM|nr:hypothetical protein [Parashewanella curva]RLV59985.1 hypothetical protein D5018_09275 [Parashewanella curva]
MVSSSQSQTEQPWQNKVECVLALKDSQGKVLAYKANIGFRQLTDTVLYGANAMDGFWSIDVFDHRPHDSNLKNSTSDFGEIVEKIQSGQMTDEEYLSPRCKICKEEIEQNKQLMHFFDTVNAQYKLLASQPEQDVFIDLTVKLKS